MSEEMIAQEYECSFSAGVLGVIWGKDMEAARAQRRITRVPYQYGLPVDTFWDLGVRGMSVWMMQRTGWEVRWIDYYESNTASLEGTVKELQAKGYTWGTHHYPHDIEVTDIVTGMTRKQILASLGFDGIVVPNIGVEEGIETTRILLSQSYFDEERCARGIQALENYRREWDDKKKVFRDQPLKDWASHGADAMRMAGVTFKDEPHPHDRPRGRAIPPRVVGGMTKNPRAA